MSSCILDASALIALLGQEAGAEVVSQAIAAGAVMNTVNLSEVVAKLADAGLEGAAIRAVIDPLGIALVGFDEDLAFQAGALRPVTRTAGLSFGDRACLALAQRLQLPVLTSDKPWESLSLGITIRLLR